jgi:hypothetical protein
MLGTAGEIVLTRRAVPQPSPHIAVGGDCGACCLGGALGLTVPEVYERFDSKGLFHYGEMGRCLRCAVMYGLADRITDVHAQWLTNHYLYSFGLPAHHEYVPWFNHIRMAIDAGYYGVAEIDFAGNCGPDTNHWILICGARTEGSVVNKIITGEVLISCSVQGERWVEAKDFLKRFGGYNVLFVRPTNV